MTIIMQDILEDKNIELGEFIVMPNHIHGIIIIIIVGAGSKPALNHQTHQNRAGLEPAPTPTFSYLPAIRIRIRGILLLQDG